MPRSDPWLALAHVDGRQEHVRLTLALTGSGRNEQHVSELLDPERSRLGGTPPELQPRRT